MTEDITDYIGQFLAIMLALFVSPLLTGWVNMCRAWLQNRSAPPLWQQYFMLRKLFTKEVVLAENASNLFRMTPLIVTACMILVCAIIPSISTSLPFASAADTIALVGIFGLARLFMALAAMDIGTAFGSLGARREMLIGFLGEPALLMVLFTTAIICGSTSLPAMVEFLNTNKFAIYPSLAFSGAAFSMVILAENARVPVDNPATHLELTMIHEALLLEYSGRYLAILELAASLKLYAYLCIGFALFFPWGIANAHNLTGMLVSIPIFLGKLMVGGVILAVIETINAKMRIFRVPEFLSTAFLLAVIGLLVKILLEKA